MGRRQAHLFCKCSPYHCSVFDFKITVIIYSKLFFIEHFLKILHQVSTLKIIHMYDSLQTQVRKAVLYKPLILGPYSNFSPYKINNNKNSWNPARISGGPSVSSLRERAPSYPRTLVLGWHYFIPSLFWHCCPRLSHPQSNTAASLCLFLRNQTPVAFPSNNL